MIKTFLNNVLSGNRIQSVQIHLDADQKEYRLVEIHRSKNSLSITDKYATQDFDDLLQKISKNKPVILSITGQGILSKKVGNDTNYQSKILFNADPDDFYWYEYRQEKEIFVTVARKELIDQEIEQFSTHQVFIVDFSIGPFVMVGVKPLLPEQTELQTKETVLVFEDEALVDFKKRNTQSAQEYTIGDEHISDEDSICFANVLNHIYPSDVITSDTDSLSSNKEEFTYKKAFNILGIFILFFF